MISIIVTCRTWPTLEWWVEGWAHWGRARPDLSLQEHISAIIISITLVACYHHISVKRPTCLSISQSVFHICFPPLTQFIHGHLENVMKKLCWQIQWQHMRRWRWGSGLLCGRRSLAPAWARWGFSLEEPGLAPSCRLGGLGSPLARKTLKKSIFCSSKDALPNSQKRIMWISMDNFLSGSCATSLNGGGEVSGELGRVSGCKMESRKLWTSHLLIWIRWNST